MNAPDPQPRSTKAVIPAWHAQFLKMLPAIIRYAQLAFRHFRPEAKEDAIQEVTDNALVAFVRLVELRKTDVAHPTVLAKFAIAQFYDGRRVGNSLNIREVLSPYAQKKKRFVVERLDYYDDVEDEWQEAVVEDHQTPVPDQVAFRIDFPAWLKILSGRDRRMATALALGHSTRLMAKRFRVSEGRVSQMRREFYQSWRSFHGESVA